MKILQVIPVLAKGGAEKVVVDLLNAQESLGHSVELLCSYPNIFDSRSAELNKSIKVTYLANSKTSKLGTYVKMFSWIRANTQKLDTYNVIHAHLTFGLFFGILTRLFLKHKKNTRPILVFTCHLVGMKVSKFKLIYHRSFSNFFDHFVLMGSDNFWNNAAKTRNFYSFVPNGVKAVEKVVTGRTSSLHIGTLSRLVAERRPIKVLDQFAEILKEIPSAQFTVGGEGPELNKLIQHADKLAITNSVTFAGKVDDVSEFYALCDFYITLNIGSTTGISGLEAVSIGIPTLAIQLDHSYHGGENDWIASFSSYSELTNFLKQLTEDEELLVNYVARQSKVFIQDYTSQKMTENYLKIYTKAL